MQKCSTHKSNGTGEKNTPDDFFTGKKVKSKNGYLFRLLYMIFRSDKFDFILEVIIVFACNFMPVIVSLIWKNILNSINAVFSLSSPYLIINFILYAAVGSISVSYYFFTETIDSLFRNKMSVAFQKRIFAKAKKLPLVYYEIPRLNDYISRAQDTFCYGTAIGTALSLSSVFSLAITFISSFIILLNFHYLLALAFIPLTLPYLLQFYLSRLNVDLNLRTSPLRRKAAAYASYFTRYEYVKETKFFDLGTFFTDKWSDVMKAVKREELKANRKISIINGIIGILDTLFYTFVVYVSILLVGNHGLDIGQFGAVFMLIGTVKQNIRTLLLFIGDLYKDAELIGQGFDYLDLKEENRSIAADPPISRTVCCRNLSFTYPLTSDKVIDSIDLDFHKGEITAFVGKNGAGKSTLAKLLLGLLPADSGNITYDGILVRDIRYENLHKNVSAVFQDFNHYYMTLRENVGVSDINSMQDTDKILDSIRQVCDGEFIEKMPDGIDTSLGKEFGGTELSGGQWQYIAIARAYFRHCSFIVLDEPSSALDPIKEGEVYRHFKELCRGKIGIIITHRLSAAALADRICFVENGKIAESGTHEELIRQGGKYAKMFRAQAELYGQ